MVVTGTGACAVCATEKGEPMPLSDRERRELEEIEQSLYAEDPQLEATVTSSDIGVVAMKRISSGVAIGVLGLVVLVAGVVLPSVPVGVVGFLVMLAGGLGAVRGIPVLIVSSRHDRPDRS